MSVPAPRRRYAINALAAVSMFAAAGCFEKPDDDDDDDGGDGGGAGIVGVWGLDSATFYGETYDYPYTYSYDGYTYTGGIRMDIRTETGGEWYGYYDYAGPSGESDSYIEEGYAMTISSTGSASYQIEVHDELSMDCTLSGDRLSCDTFIDDSEPATLEWQRL